MTAPIRIRDDYQTSRTELREALANAIAKKRPPLGFVLGLIGTLVLASAAGAVYLGWFPGV